MRYFYTSVMTLFLIGILMIANATRSETEMSAAPAKENSFYVVARTWFPPMPAGNVEEKKKKLENLTAHNATWVVWPMLTCIRIKPGETEISLEKFYTPGKKFSTDVAFQVTTKENRPLTHKGALLLEVIAVYESYKDFVAAYPQIHPTSNGKVMSLFLNFNPPDATLQNIAKRENQTLVVVTIGPKIVEGWPKEMKEANIRFLRHILAP